MSPTRPNVKRSVEQVLAAPYARVFRQDDGGVSAEVLEFPGCYSSGEDGPSAWANLEEAMTLWAESQLQQGPEIPSPMASTGYQGRISLRVLLSVHRRAALLAAAEGVSLNRWLSAAVDRVSIPPSNASITGESAVYRTVGDAVSRARNGAERP